MARGIQHEADRLGLGEAELQASAVGTPQDYVGYFDILITSQPLRSVTRRLYVDGHYAQAVEEAYKCLNHTVKVKCKLPSDGADLMQQAFSEKNPALKLNHLRTTSQRDEQTGYMMILAGCMRGIRNPRAHESGLWDSPDTALEFLVWANHLMKVVGRAKRIVKREKPSSRTPTAAL